MYIGIVMELNGVMKEIKLSNVHFMHPYALKQQVHCVHQMIL